MRKMPPEHVQNSVFMRVALCRSRAPVDPSWGLSSIESNRLYLLNPTLWFEKCSQALKSWSQPFPQTFDGDSV